jgi:hypothetical protein
MQMKLVAAALWAAAACLAQSGAGGGSIQGTLRDSSGAVIAGARLSCLHVETGRATSAVTNHEGFFSTPPLSIGKYRMRVEAPGMSAWEGELTVETGRTAEVSPVLSPGKISEAVTVTDAVPLVATADAADGSTLESQRIRDLPMDGRALGTLVADVTPGVEPGPWPSWDSVRTGGLMVESTTFTQDGATSANRELGAGLTNAQGLDSIAEVRVETSGSSAKFNSPTSVIVSTKGGANRVSGSLFETARNNAFGVARGRQDFSWPGQAPYRAPKLIRNEFGGSIGGPVVVPSLGLNGKKWYDGRNRTFFFFSREGLEMRSGLTNNFTVPTMAMRAGDFSGLYDAQGRKITLYDPLTTTTVTAANGRRVSSRAPFVDNRIPVGRQSPLSKFVWGITPPPSDITNPLVAENLKMSVPTNTSPNLSSDPYTIRVDHRFSEKDNVFVKVNGGNPSRQFMGSCCVFPPTLNNEVNMTYLTVPAIAGALSWTHIFTPGFFLEVLANRTWQNMAIASGPVQKNWSQELGLPNPLGQIGFPDLTNVGFSAYREGDARRNLRTWTTNIVQNYTLIRGTHNIQFGGSWHNEMHHYLLDQTPISGSASFASLATALESATSGSATNPAITQQTGHDAANFYLGYAATYTAYLRHPMMRLHQNNWGLYLQDNYKVTRRLTVMPGLRWDINPAFTERNQLINAFDVPSHSLMLPEPLEYYYKIGATTPEAVSIYQNVGVKFTSAEELGRSKQVFQSNYFDIGPRGGFAYRMFDGNRQLVVRGGYGVYLSLVPLRSMLLRFNQLPFSATFSVNPNSAAQSPDGIPNYLLRNAPTVTAGVNSANAIDMRQPNAIGRGVGVTGMGSLPTTRIQEWNLALEKQLNSSTVLRARYAGKHGDHMDQLSDINPIQPNYVWFVTTGQPLPTGTFANVARRLYDQNAYTTVYIYGGTGILNSSTLAFEVERRFSKGLGFQAFYTLTHTVRMGGVLSGSYINSIPQAYLPGAVPTDPDKLNRFLTYQRDTQIPKHRVRWNWNYDLPFGKGRRLWPAASSVVNALVGGWRVSGTGTVMSTWFTMPTDNWGEMGNFEVYGKKYKITDCRGTPASATSPNDERCVPGYLWFNGYISERNIDSRNAAGLRNGVFGLPADYKPAQKPINAWPKGGKVTDPGSAYWDTNIVTVGLKDGSTREVTYDTGLHPWRNQSMVGPFNWITDASLMKFFPIRERVRLRVNIDVFNVLNNQGLVAPNSTGFVSLLTSYGATSASGVVPGFKPRQVQLGARLEW